MNVEGYEALLDKAEETGWPKWYKTDLDVDKEILGRCDAPDTFVWLLRETGTHLLSWYDDYAEACIASRRDEDGVYAYTPRRGLHAITPEEARAFLKRRPPKPDPPIRIYTDAPESYDGFGTRTIDVVGTSTRGNPVRLVEVLPVHLEWQRSRYLSGLYISATEEQWPQMQSCIMKAA